MLSHAALSVVYFFLMYFLLPNYESYSMTHFDFIKSFFLIFKITLGFIFVLPQKKVVFFFKNKKLIKIWVKHTLVWQSFTWKGFYLIIAFKQIRFPDQVLRVRCLRVHCHNSLSCIRTSLLLSCTILYLKKSEFLSSFIDMQKFCIWSSDVMSICNTDSVYTCTPVHLYISNMKTVSSY